MIVANNFCKIYEATRAVNSLSFAVGPGDILGLVGRNGAGKTTTLRSLTGIIPVSSGTLCIGGYDVTRDPIAVKQITTYVPDDPQLFHDLSVDQHLQFTASVYGIDNCTARMQELLAAFELTSKRNTVAANLSRGMRQKLAICCGLLAEPKAFLLDEPMTGLDPQAIRVLKNTIVQVAAQGAAVMISSHLLAMVEDICSHALILESGTAKFFGTLDELRQHFSGIGQPAGGSSLEHAYFATIENAAV